MGEVSKAADDVRKHKDRALELLERGKRDAAIGELRAVLAIAPSDLFARQKLGDVLVRVGLGGEAIEHFAALAGRWAAEGQVLKAIAMAHTILQIDPLHTETQRALADLVARRDGGLDAKALPRSMQAAFSLPPPAPREGAPRDDARRDEAAELARIPLFSELDAASFVVLLPLLERRSMREGETIVTEGERGDAMFAVVTGAVRVQRRLDSGALQPIAQMGEGTFFGEMALVADVPRFADVVASVDGELLVIRRGALERLVTLQPAARDVLMRFHHARLNTNLLRAAPMFLSVPAEERVRLLGATSVISYPADAPIVQQGEPSAGVHVILRGTCEVLHETPQGPRPLPLMGEGDVFGEIALLSNAPSSATVRAVGPCVVLRIEPGVARELLRHRPLLVALTALGQQRLVRSRAVLGGGVV
jgi:cAMP-dependent protein kinase regulator